MIEFLQEHAAHFAYWLSILCLCGFTGSLFADSILHFSEFRSHVDFDEQLKRTRLWLGSAFIVSCGPVLIFTGMEMTGETFAETLRAIPFLLSDTHYGTMWLLRVGVALLLCLLVAHPRIARSALGLRTLIALLFILLSFTFSATSHSAIRGMFSFDALVQHVHVMSILNWAGAIMVLAYISSNSGTHLLIVAIRSYSAFLIWIAIAAVLSGLVLATEMLNHFRDLWRSSYGQVLAVKLLLVIGMLAVAAMVRFSQMSSPIEQNSPTKRHDQLIKIDIFLVWFALLFATQLTHTAPPSHLLPP